MLVFCVATLGQSALSPAFTSALHVSLSPPLDFEFLMHECFFLFFFWFPLQLLI